MLHTPEIADTIARQVFNKLCLRVVSTVFCRYFVVSGHGYRN